MSHQISFQQKNEVAQRLGICERTLENLVSSRRFPPGLRLGKHVVWDSSVVERWLEKALEYQQQWEPPKSRKTPR